MTKRASQHRQPPHESATNSQNINAHTSLSFFYLRAILRTCLASEKRISGKSVLCWRDSPERII
ncbi:hypothetical protein GP434_001823 [Salmonella enterica subsp. enterica]|nr:hypothetical protein [Salmonella enterica subsp. enterica]